MTEPGRQGQRRLSEKLSEGAPLAAVVLVVSAVALLLAYRLLPVLELIAIALLLALVLRAAVRGLRRLGVPRRLAVAILLLGIAGFGAFVWLVIVPNLRQEAQALASEGPGSLRSLARLLRDLPLLPDLSTLLDRLQELLSGVVGSLPSLAYTAVSTAAALVAVVFMAIYFAVDPQTYVFGILRLVPRERRSAAEEFIDRLGKRLRGWIVGTVLVAAFVGTAGGVGLWLLGVPLPLTFGLLAGLLNVIPLLGSVLGGLLPALMALTISPVKALEVVALFVAINQIEGNILQPRIMGGEVRVPLAMIIVAFLVAGTLLSNPVIGAFLAVPGAVFVSVVLEELTEKVPSLGDGEEGDRRGPS